MKNPELVKKMIKASTSGLPEVPLGSAKKAVSASRVVVLLAQGVLRDLVAKRKSTADDTPNTPDVAESKISRMKVDDLRRDLKSRGVKVTADMKKPEWSRR